MQIEVLSWQWVVQYLIAPAFLLLIPALLKAAWSLSTKLTSINFSIGEMKKTIDAQEGRLAELGRLHAAVSALENHLQVMGQRVAELERNVSTVQSQSMGRDEIMDVLKRVELTLDNLLLRAGVKAEPVKLVDR